MSSILSPLLVNIGLPKTTFTLSLFKDLIFSRIPLVPITAVGIIGISFLIAKYATPLFPSLRPSPFIVPSGKIQIHSFFCICFWMFLIVEI